MNHEEVNNAARRPLWHADHYDEAFLNQEASNAFSLWMVASYWVSEIFGGNECRNGRRIW